MAFTVENLSSVQLLSDLALSPDGSKVVYCVTPSFKTGEQSVEVTEQSGINRSHIQGHTRPLPSGILPTRRKLTAQGS